jgi:hypothetical protein
MGPQSVDNGPEILPSKRSSSVISEDEWATVLKEESLHDPEPSIERSTVLVAGVCVFVLAMIWPPLILVVTYLLSVLLPYSFRKNDDATARRKLLDKFEKEDTLSDPLREIPDDVNLTDGYWTNSRYVDRNAEVNKRAFVRFLNVAF